MKKMLFCFSLIVTLASCSSGWSPEYKQTVKDTITTRLSLNQPLGPGTKAQKAELCNCMLKVFEKTYPGQLPTTGIPKDTMRKAFFHCCPWIEKI